MLVSVLAGKKPYEDAPPAIQSSCMLHIYEGACAILEMEMTKRKAALERIPTSLRPLVEEEVKRLWRLRNDV